MRPALALGLAAFAPLVFAVGSGVFQPHPITPAFGTSGEMVGIADLNGDTRPDAVVAGSSSTSIWISDGSGNFSPHTGTSMLGVGGTVGLGDLNGDGRVDLVVSGNALASVFLNGVAGFSATPSSTFGNGGFVALGDLDGDGDLDAVLGGTVWLNNGSGVFSAHPTPSFSPAAFTSVALGDMNADGDPDVVATAGQGVFVFINNGFGAFTQHPSSPFGTVNPSKLMQQAVLGDVDGDADLDVVAVLTDLGGGASANIVLRNGGSGNLVQIGSFAGNTRVALADVDGDGDADVLTDTSAGVWLNSGSGTFTAHATATNFGASVTWFALGDIDNDGDRDVLVSHGTGATGVWRNINGVSSFDVSVSVNPAGGGSASCSPDPVAAGGSSTCTATANPGFAFAGWSGNCTGQTCTLTNVTGARSVTANFSVATYPIATSVDPAAGGTVSCSPNPVSHGGSSTCTATPASGFTFVGWSGSCTGSTCSLTNVTSAKSVIANFTSTPGTFTVTTNANPPNGGTVSCSPNPVPSGDSTTCTATAKVGFAFAGWSGDCSGSTCTISNVTSPKTVTAAFTRVDPTGPPRLGNISTRANVLTGNDVMIGGFVIGGSTSKTVAIVATGPSLQQFGISNPLANPSITLVRSSDQAVIRTNNDWQTDPNAPQLQAVGLAPAHPSEAGMFVSLAPGAYTAIVQGFDGGTGVAVIGVYEVDHPETPLINISTRARAGTGGDVVIGGFVVQGSGPQTVAIVATGPSLASFNISDPLPNPTLTLVRSSDQAVIATNDDWQSDPNASLLEGAGLDPPNSLESGLFVTLQPGAYTAILSGVGGATGVGVIGVYRVN